jgi:membrane protein
MLSFHLPRHPDWHRVAASRAVRLAVATARGWRDCHVTRLAASLSFFALLSLVPLLLTFDAVFSLVVDRQALVSGVDQQIASLIGPDQARAVRAMLDHARSPSLASLQAAFGSVLTVITAAGVFIDLKDSMDAIWQAPPRRGGGWFAFLRDYFAPISMVLGFGFLLLVSLLLDALVGALATAVTRWDAGGLTLIAIGNLAAGWAIAALLFAAIFRFLPAVRISWREVWLGAAITATLFVVGRFLIGIYLGTSNFTGRYGSAGAVMAIIVWIYYSAQILFIGAVFTREDQRLRAETTLTPPIPG